MTANFINRNDDIVTEQEKVLKNLIKITPFFIVIILGVLNSL